MAFNQNIWKVTKVNNFLKDYIFPNNNWHKLAITFKEAQEKVATIIKNRILVGHAVYNDLKVLMLSHPTLLIRDTSRYKPFRKLAKGRSPGLKMLVKEVLGISIQAGSHSSVSEIVA